MRICLPREPTGRTYTAKWKRGRGCNYMVVLRSSLANSESQNVRPQRMFVVFTKPCSAVRVLLGPEQKMAHLVANTIANKAYLKSTLYLTTMKRCACSHATDFRCRFSVLGRCIEVLSTFQNVSAHLAKYILRGKVFAKT